jgi:hypothetical protein
MARRGEDRRGATLVVVVLLLLALLALAQGALTLARLELATSLADLRMLRARAAAEAGLRRAVMGPAPAGRGDVAVWGRIEGPSGSLAGATYRTVIERLSREIWLVEGVGAADDGPGTVRIGRLVWSMDPLARVGAARASLEIGPDAPLRLAGRVDGADATGELPPLVPGACLAWAAGLDSVLPSGRLPPVVRMPVADSLPQPSLGRLKLDNLLAMIPTRVSGVGTPGPVESSGRCATGELWNWGDPLHPTRPCGVWFPVEVAEGNLTVRGGVGQGVLVVRDTLTLADSARFFGVILTGGPLRLDPGVRVSGLVRAYGGADVDVGAELDASACWALRVLDAATDLTRRYVPLGGSERVGPL